MKLDSLATTMSNLHITSWFSSYMVKM